MWETGKGEDLRFSAESVAPLSPLESPTVPWSPPQSWRHFGDGRRWSLNSKSVVFTYGTASQGVVLISGYR